mgnify:FL=1|tara:strand:+ start:913 stop:1101 length:189 start_codon:yes stop_codon:yes gene_type:complete
MQKNFKEALFKALIILVPSYTMAVLTEKMVYVLPIVVVSGIIAMAVIPDKKKRLDDEGDIDE